MSGEAFAINSTVLDHLDKCIRHWRKIRDSHPHYSSEEMSKDMNLLADSKKPLVAACYIDAYQSIRTNFFGEVLSPEPEASPEAAYAEGNAFGKIYLTGNTGVHDTIMTAEAMQQMAEMSVGKPLKDERGKEIGKILSSEVKDGKIVTLCEMDAACTNPMVHLPLVTDIFSEKTLSAEEQAEQVIRAAASNSFPSLRNVPTPDKTVNEILDELEKQDGMPRPKPVPIMDKQIAVPMFVIPLEDKLALKRILEGLREDWKRIVDTNDKKPAWEPGDIKVIELLQGAANIIGHLDAEAQPIDPGPGIPECQTYEFIGYNKCLPSKPPE